MKISERERLNLRVDSVSFLETVAGMALLPWQRRVLESLELRLPRAAARHSDFKGCAGWQRQSRWFREARRVRP